MAQIIPLLWWCVRAYASLGAYFPLFKMLSTLGKSGFKVMAGAYAYLFCRIKEQLIKNSAESVGTCHD
jgi:hypothetical protein